MSKALTTVETAKLIREELKSLYPGVKFSVRKEHVGTIFVYHEMTDLNIRTELSAFLRQFEGWFTFQTEYVFEQYREAI